LLLICFDAAANAVCYYKGEWNKRTTLREEYVDSKWVARVRVLSAIDGVVEPGKPDAGMSWTVYRLKVVERFKGRPPGEIKFFTDRNSGGFYMDRPWVPLPRGHDVGGEYLLFLNPIEPHPHRPSASAAAAFVNYSCGQSREWRQVSRESRLLLRKLAAQN
jgi:hypothetical protein